MPPPTRPPTPPPPTSPRGHFTRHSGTFPRHSGASRNLPPPPTRACCQIVPSFLRKQELGRFGGSTALLQQTIPAPAPAEMTKMRLLDILPVIPAQAGIWRRRCQLAHVDTLPVIPAPSPVIPAKAGISRFCCRFRPYRMPDLPPKPARKWHKTVAALPLSGFVQTPWPAVASRTRILPSANLDSALSPASRFYASSTGKSAPAAERRTAPPAAGPTCGWNYLPPAPPIVSRHKQAPCGWNYSGNCNSCNTLPSGSRSVATHPPQCSRSGMRRNSTPCAASRRCAA